MFTTNEIADYTANWLVMNPSGRLRPFLRDKLFLSLHTSLQHRALAVQDATGLTDTVMLKLHRQINGSTLEAKQIKRAAQVALNRFDKVASVHYCALHQDN